MAASRNRRNIGVEPPADRGTPARPRRRVWHSGATTGGTCRGSGGEAREPVGTPGTGAEPYGTGAGPPAGHAGFPGPIRPTWKRARRPPDGRKGREFCGDSRSANLASEAGAPDPAAGWTRPQVGFAAEREKRAARNRPWPTHRPHSRDTPDSARSSGPGSGLRARIPTRHPARGCGRVRRPRAGQR